MIYQIVVEKSLGGEPEGYNILVYIEEEADVFVVVQIDYSYYFAEYDSENGNYRVQLITSKNIFNSSVEVPIVGIMYNYSKQIIEDVRKGFIKLNSISTFEILNLTPGIETQTKIWTGNLIVSKVEGPFQNNKLVDEIDLNLPVYYLATPSISNAHNSQILSIKWEYQYNDAEITKFNNSKRSIIIEKDIKKCKIECRFHNRKDIETIKLYAFFNQRSNDKVSQVRVLGSTKNKKCYLTLEEIESVFGILEKQKEFRKQIIDNLNKFIYDYEKEIHIDTVARKAHFFAQVGAETLGINKDWIVESDVFRYRVASAKSAFGTRAEKLAKKGLLEAYCKERPQKKLLNYVYSNLFPEYANGNGGISSGDGYNYRGRGLIQLTGRYNYKKASNNLKAIFPDEYVDFEKFPDKIKEVKYAVLSAIVFWEQNEIWKLADSNPIPKTKDEFKKIRKKVNSAAKGLDVFTTYLIKGTEIFEKKCSDSKAKESTSDESTSDEASSINGKWHDPVDNPISTLYTQNGSNGENGKHWGLFGKTRINKNHSGLDLFAETGTKIYSCVEGTIYNRKWHSGYGNTITVKVKDVEAFLKFKKNYKLQYEKNGEIIQGADWNESNNIYLFYAHLDTVNNFNFGDTVKCGEILGTTGRSGVLEGTCAPHLHFEIFCDYVMAVGTQYRINPAMFVTYKGYSEQSDSERNEQKKTRNNGQIKGVNGEEKLNISDMKGFKK